MNILFFVGRVTYGGGEKVRNWLANSLINSGQTVYYVMPQNEHDYTDELNKVHLGKVQIIEYDKDLKKIKPFSYCRKLIKIYRTNGIDVLIYFGGSLVEQIVARHCGVKVILSERFYNGFRPWPSRILKQIQYRIADGYVFQTLEASKIYGQRAKKRSVIIPNPIIDDLPLPIYDNLRKEIVTAGRLTLQKDHRTLIDAFAEFHHKHSEYRLIIYGSGPLKEELEQRISSLKLNNSAVIVSGKTNICELERGAELFVLSSLAEGMPNALIEAMSIGLQCISTDCPIYGSRMLIKNEENGYLVPVKDARAMCDAMCYAVENPVKADEIRHNAVRVRETLNEVKIAGRWKSYIEQVRKR